ncbi:MAG: carbamoyltransferase N-terminal domain-containing protein [Bacteroidales bacterium]
MKILGILNLNQDPAASLMINGKLISLAEEERFVRVKHAMGYFPENSIKFCLENNNLNLSDINFITIGWDIYAYKSRIRKHFEDCDKLFNKDIKSKNWESNQLSKYNPENFIENLKKDLIHCGFKKKDIPPVNFYGHHYSHAISAYIPSKFKESLILTIDGHGEENCTVIWIAKNNKINKYKQFNIPHSLGWFYAAATRFCGFTPNSCEGKTMGLAPYGKPNIDIRKKLEKILTTQNHGYKIDPHYLFYGERIIANEFTESFVHLFGKPRYNEQSVFDSPFAEFSYESQLLLERIVCHLVKTTIKETGIRNICLAGGVALNCKMNRVISTLKEVENLYVQPMSNDIGTTFGLSLALSIDKGFPIADNFMDNTHLGPEFGKMEIESCLKKQIEIPIPQ